MIQLITNTFTFSDTILDKIHLSLKKNKPSCLGSIESSNSITIEDYKSSQVYIILHFELYHFSQDPTQKVLSEAPNAKMSRIRSLVLPRSTNRHSDTVHHIMSSSDEDYVADDSDDDRNVQTVTGTHGTRSTGPVKNAANSRGARGGDGKEKGKKQAAWEKITRSWDIVIEGADGSINSAVESLNKQNKRKRFVSCPCSIRIELANSLTKTSERYNTITKRNYKTSHSDY
jgi:hypothetical protein